MRTHTTDDLSPVNAEVYAKAMNKQGTLRSACKVQAAASVYPVTSARCTPIQHVVYRFGKTLRQKG